MLDIGKKFKKAKSLIFSPSEDLRNKPSVVLLVFNNRQESEEIRQTMTVDSANYKLIILEEQLADLINISIIFNHTNEVYNLDNLSFNKNELDLFKRIQPQNGKFIFGTGYFEKDQLIFNVEESKNPKFILFDGYEIN
ncbi:hypothetical protein [Chryseobacterium aquaticum]|uniref:hypothetical protein n=1 Tax=Chryseobacterium aquaticum TaxID=452084 RepID=UPI003F72CD39